MKTRYSIYALCLLALMATGCKKENNGRVGIVAENMRSDSKIVIDLDNINSATWLAGEYIDVNGTPHVIRQDAEGFYLSGINETGSVVAVYPGSSTGGNDVVVSNNEVVIKRLTINRTSPNYYEEVVFPMVATASAVGDQLLFKHITAGLKLTLVNRTYSPMELASVKIVAQSTNRLQNLTVDGVTARWAVQGPALPPGQVGEREDDYSAANACEMNFDFATTYSDYGYAEPTKSSTTVPSVTIWNGGGWFPFCVPITVSSLRYLTVIGYDPNGAQLFYKTKDLGAEMTLSSNNMYIIPNIEIY